MTSFTPPRTWTTSEVVTSAMMNTNVRDNENALWPYTVAGQIAVSSSTTALIATVPGWNPMSPPTSPGAVDDEFNDSSISGNWTEFDVNSRQTAVEGAGGITLTKTAAANNEWAGYYKIIPGGDFTIWTKVSWLGTALAANYEFGLVLWEDATNVAKKLYTFEMMRTTTVYAGNAVRYWTNYTTWSSDLDANTETVAKMHSLFLRLRRNTTNYWFEYSMDGISWFNHNAGAVTLSGTPTHFGIGGNIYTAATTSVLFSFFRYIASDVGIAGVMSGNRY